MSEERWAIAVAGVAFEGRQALLIPLYRAQESGAKLAAELRREPKNAYDKNAVKVIIDGKHVGYVSRRLALELAPRMDRGDRIEVREVKIVYGGDGEVTYGARLEISIFGESPVKEAAPAINRYAAMQESKREVPPYA